MDRLSRRSLFGFLGGAGAAVVARPSAAVEPPKFIVPSTYRVRGYDQYGGLVEETLSVTDPGHTHTLSRYPAGLSYTLSS